MSLERIEREWEIARRLEEVGRHILMQTRNELYLHMRFLDVALSSFDYQMDGAAVAAATDGNVIYYNSRDLGGLFRKERRAVNRLYLHMVLHCLLAHVFDVPRGAEDWWDLACDIAAESIADGLQLRCLKLPVSWERESAYRYFRGELKVLTAQGICHVLQEKSPDERTLQKWRAAFTVDDHRYWAREREHPQNQQTRDKWQDISEKAELNLDAFSKEASEADGGLREQLAVAHRETMDYRTFLQKFAVLSEEVQIDPDQFDYVFYSYGLSLYKNMPLIEPQETKEVRRIEDFAVVIDTSMSCSGELVRSFLEETYAILTEKENFFHKINLHIIQCDEKVQSDQKITSAEELRDCMEHFEIVGGGGTDFRPAFAYVEELCRKREFERLRGLLYFTDGFGTYPKRMPPFQTAFIFCEDPSLADAQERAEVPPWAVKLVLDRGEIEKGRGI